MDTVPLLLALMAAALAGVSFQAWRIGNDRRDVALIAFFGGLCGMGSAATALL